MSEINQEMPNMISGIDAMRGVGQTRAKGFWADAWSRVLKRNGARLPVTALVDQFYADVQGMGGQRWDTSSLIKRLR